MNAVFESMHLSQSALLSAWVAEYIFCFDGFDYPVLIPVCAITQSEADALAVMEHISTRNLARGRFLANVHLPRERPN